MCFSLKDLGFGPLPVLIGLIFFIQTFIVYCIAIIKHDVDPILPYLSSAADKRPESCLFAIGANISSFLLALLVFVRHRQLRQYINRAFGETPAVWSNRIRWFGYLSALGLFLVANVQETAIISVHMTAAFMTFGGFCLYMIGQCYITYNTTPEVTLISVFYYRLVFTILGCLSMCSAVSFGIAAANKFHETYPNLPTPRPWNRRFYQPGYELHQISAISEWICAASQILFMQSFGPEFEEISVRYYFQNHYTFEEVSNEGEIDQLEGPNSL